MKHLKLYEQFDFDDLSDEELFGKEIKRNLIKGAEGYYAIEWRNLMSRVIPRENERLYLYKDYDWINVKYYNDHIVDSHEFFNINELNDNDIVMICDNKMKDIRTIWHRIRKKDLPENIKKEINDLNFL